MAEAKHSVLGNRIGWLSRFAYHNAAIARNVRATTNLSMTQARIVLHVALHPDKSMGTIASCLNLKASTTAVAAGCLEQAGLLERTADTVDKRSAHATLTKKGYEFIPQFADVYGAAMNSIEDFMGAAKFEKAKLLLFPAGTVDLFEERSAGELSSVEEVCAALHISADDASSARIVEGLADIEHVAYGVIEMDKVESELLNLNVKGALLLRGIAALGDECALRSVQKLTLLQPNVISTTLDTLEDRNLLERLADENDHRAVNVRLTAEGAELVHSTNRAFARAFDECFPGFKALQY